LNNISSVEEMKLVANNKKDVASSLLANTDDKVSKLAVKVNFDSRIKSELNQKVKELAQRKFGVGLRKRVWVNGHPDTALSAMSNMIVEAGCEVIEKMLSKQKQTTSYAISGQDAFRADKASRCQELQDEFKLWKLDETKTNYPVFHLNAIRDVIRRKIPTKEDMRNNRTHAKYFKIIMKMSKEVSTSRFDITGFMQHEFRS